MLSIFPVFPVKMSAPLGQLLESHPILPFQGARGILRITTQAFHDCGISPEDLGKGAAPKARASKGSGKPPRVKTLAFVASLCFSCFLYVAIFGLHLIDSIQKAQLSQIDVMEAAGYPLLIDIILYLRQSKIDNISSQNHTQIDTRGFSPNKIDITESNLARFQNDCGSSTSCSWSNEPLTASQSRKKTNKLIRAIHGNATCHKAPVTFMTKSFMVDKDISNSRFFH